ncbi:MAG TPA: hypothetical protein VF324_02980 [Methanobacterium sp.]
MPYLVCENCRGYYELQKGESVEDFDACQCGGKLRYDKRKDHTNFDLHGHKHLNDKKNSNYELNLYKRIRREEIEENHHKYGKNNEKFFSKNFIINSGFIILTFSIIPLFFGFIYSNWIFYLIAGINIFLSLAFFFLNNNQDQSRKTRFQKMFIFTGIIFGLTTLYLLIFLGSTVFLQESSFKGFLSRIGSIFIYLASLYFSAYFCYIFLRNSRMKDRIDLLNSRDKEKLYFNYYYIIFVVFTAMIAGMITVIWLKYVH